MDIYPTRGFHMALNCLDSWLYFLPVKRLLTSKTMVQTQLCLERRLGISSSAYTFLLLLSVFNIQTLLHSTSRLLNTELGMNAPKTPDSATYYDIDEWKFLWAYKKTDKNNFALFRHVFLYRSKQKKHNSPSFGNFIKLLQFYNSEKSSEISSWWI